VKREADSFRTFRKKLEGFLNRCVRNHILGLFMKIQIFLLSAVTAFPVHAATLGTWSASGGANPGTDGWTLTTSTGNSSQAGSFQGN
jgi:hypothetical protein